jgi:aminoglycoside/choline kinase family phosphotransferase
MLLANNGAISFLQEVGWRFDNIEALPPDCSNRIYFRLSQVGASSVILMDSSKEIAQFGHFLRVGEFLRSNNLSAPEIYEVDQTGGFAIIEDFGDQRYKDLVEQPGSCGLSIEELYKLAIDVLLASFSFDVTCGVEHYSDEKLLNEVRLFTKWYVPTLLGGDISAAAEEDFVGIWQGLLPLTRLFDDNLVLRDYHSENIFFLPEKDGLQRVGIIDFQDALVGSPIYDVVSLLEDARCDIGRPLADKMVDYYVKNNSSITRKDFLSSYAILGVQRNLKIMGIFTRRYVQYGDRRHMKYLSTVWSYIQNAVKHPLLLPLKKWLDSVVQ